jgi:SAM-dependent methyltransferase
MRALIPVRLKSFYHEYKSKSFKILDVGCGNYSPSITKTWFKNCEYYGVDKDIYNNNESDLRLMKKFYKIDLSKNIEQFDTIPNNFFDVVIFSHVIEHLTNGLEVILALMKKTKKGGKIYIEFPSIKSLSLPSMHGTLNFCDDPTHVRLYSLQEVANILLSSNFKVIKGGRRRDYGRIILLPIFIVYQLLKYKKLSAGIFWDITGFADYIFAEKRTN